jgi:hypothetical protein
MRFRCARLVNSHIDNGEDSIRIAIPPICLHRRPQQRLGKYELREVMQMELLRVKLEELGEQVFEGVIINRWEGVEKLKVDVDEGWFFGL